MDLKRPDDALESARRAADLSPDHPEFWELVASILGSALYRFDEAFAASERSLQIDPDRADAHVVRGELLLTVNAFDEALASADQAVQRDPDSADGWALRCDVLTTVGR